MDFLLSHYWEIFYCEYTKRRSIYLTSSQAQMETFKAANLSLGKRTWPSSAQNSGAGHTGVARTLQISGSTMVLWLHLGYSCILVNNLSFNTSQVDMADTVSLRHCWWNIILIGTGFTSFISDYYQFYLLTKKEKLSPQDSVYTKIVVVNINFPPIQPLHFI